MGLGARFNFRDYGSWALPIPFHLRWTVFADVAPGRSPETVQSVPQYIVPERFGAALRLRRSSLRNIWSGMMETLLREVH